MTRLDDRCVTQVPPQAAHDYQLLSCAPGSNDQPGSICRTISRTNIATEYVPAAAISNSSVFLPLQAQSFVPSLNTDNKYLVNVQVRTSYHTMMKLHSIIITRLRIYSG